MGNNIVWTPERRAQWSAMNRERWRAGVYAKLSDRMREFNKRALADPSFKAAHLAGVLRAGLRPEVKAQRSEVAKRTMSRPECRAQARAHYLKIGHSSEASKRGWVTRRLKNLRAKAEKAKRMVKK